MQLYTVYFISKLLYMFRVVSPPIVRNTNSCIYSIWYWSTVVATCRYPPQKRPVATTVDQKHAVDTVICAPDDGWRDHPKHVEQFRDKINCV